MKDYIEQAHQTSAPLTPELLARFQNPSNIELIHATLGMCTEIGEFADNLKKAAFYGTHFSMENAVEEVGDILWYIAKALRIIGVPFEHVMNVNIAKLRKRFPNKFTEYDATHRNLGAEAETLAIRGGVDRHGQPEPLI